MHTSRHAGRLLAMLLLLGPFPVRAGSILEAPEDVADASASASNNLPAAPADTNIAAEALLTSDEAAARGAELDRLINHIRKAYEQSLPADQIDAAQEDQFLREVRGHLEAAEIPMPSLDPDDYTRRNYKEHPSSHPTDAAKVTGRAGSVTVSDINGEAVYTYRDANGVVLFEGSPQSQGDRVNLPREAWEIITEQERLKFRNAEEASTDDVDREP